MSKKKLGNWIVRVNCKVVKDVFCFCCTEEEAIKDPFSHADSEEEIDQRDWEFVKIEPND